MKVKCSLADCRSLLIALLAAPAAAQAPIHVFWGQLPGEHLGEVVANLGDLDGDGVNDIGVGTTYANSQVGVARVFSGKTAEVLYAYSGINKLDNFGFIAGVGDTNRDEIPDFAIGAYNEDFKGVARIFSGADGTVIQTIAPGIPGGWGLALAGAGDVDSDGSFDVVVSAPGAGGVGEVRIYSGQTWLPLMVFQGMAPGGFFGWTVSGVGDIDRDGIPDIAVGAPQEDTNGPFAGAIRVFSGHDGSLLLARHGQPHWTYGSYGHGIAAVGDQNADGVIDLAIGAPGVGGTAELVEVISGADSSLIYSLRSMDPESNLGYSVSSIGDYDGDGVNDILVGAPYYQDLAKGHFGMARIYSGGTQSILLELYGGPANAFGWSLASLGDMNGDGTPDFAVGDPNAGGNSFQPGAARVYLGKCAAPQPYCTAKMNSQGCVPKISSSGAPSLSLGNSFFLIASDVINNQPGILAWSTIQATTPFFGGTLCLGPPVIRTVGQSSGGSPPPSNCSGSFSFHFSQAYMEQFLIAAGMALFAQYWYRDPGHPDGTGVGLTDASQFTVCM